MNTNMNTNMNERGMDELMDELPEILESHEIPDENTFESKEAFIKRKRREFLDETIEHFSNNPRASKDGICVYSHSVNGGCAIGRKLTAEKAEEMGDGPIDLNHLFDKLPATLSLMGRDFLYNVQNLHDISVFWRYIGKKGWLTELGLGWVAQTRYLFIDN